MPPNSEWNNLRSAEAVNEIVDRSNRWMYVIEQDASFGSFADVLDAARSEVFLQNLAKTQGALERVTDEVWSALFDSIPPVGKPLEAVDHAIYETATANLSFDIDIRKWAWATEATAIAKALRTRESRERERMGQTLLEAMLQNATGIVRRKGPFAAQKSFSFTL